MTIFCPPQQEVHSKQDCWLNMSKLSSHPTGDDHQRTDSHRVKSQQLNKGQRAEMFTNSLINPASADTQRGHQTGLSARVEGTWLLIGLIRRKLKSVQEKDH
ncbi:hypothetical protein ILYODFUR_003675 [Ilyodon furcidens]|uniref:Uncharacterized protein n=1 Tax=Ilyodon furcidens TaxID=33524 RepID=A0ABV0UH22_9TELE